ncbi:MAG TPA: hypothetical protein VHW91_07235 [Candidatus Dormibacteraeota bacterium]|nr:hypothetical protein [Candidatus Dormibacteraeota bacterium]
MAEQHSPSGEPMPDPRHHQDSPGTERVREVVRDAFYTMLGAASWAFEKTDAMAHNWLHEGQSGSQEGRRQFDRFAERTRRAGEDLGRRVQDSVRTARSSMPLATREQVASLERQVADLTRQIESLKGGGAGTTTAPKDRPPVG